MKTNENRTRLIVKKNYLKPTSYARLITIGEEVALITLLWMFLVAIMLLALPLLKSKPEIISYSSGNTPKITKNVEAPLLEEIPYVHRISYKTDDDPPMSDKATKIYLY